MTAYESVSSGLLLGGGSSLGCYCTASDGTYQGAALVAASIERRFGAEGRSLKTRPFLCAVVHAGLLPPMAWSGCTKPRLCLFELGPVCGGPGKGTCIGLYSGMHSHYSSGSVELNLLHHQHTALRIQSFSLGQAECSQARPSRGRRESMAQYKTGVDRWN